MSLSWAAPASTGGSPVSGYNVYEGTTADLSGNAPVTSVTGTVVTVTDLINGTRYYFRVAAVNRVGGGPASSEVSAVPLTVPGAPTGLTATPGNSRVTLSWAAPPSGGAAISDYLIFDGTRRGGENRTPVNGSLVTATSYTVTGLTNGTTYYFRVIAVNAAGKGPLSAEAPATLPAYPADFAPSEYLDVGHPHVEHPDVGHHRTDRADRDPGQHPGPPVVDRARVGWRLGHQLQGLSRQPPGRAGERRDRHHQEHRRHRGRSV